MKKTLEFSNTSSPIAVDNTNRLDLNNPQKAWLVKKGKVDIFFSIKKGEQQSRLFHITRIKAGDLILGMNLSPWLDRLSIMGIGVVGSEVQPLDMKDIKKPLNIEATAEAINTWVEGVIPNKAPIPKVHEKLDLEGSFDLKSGTFLVAQNHPLWLYSPAFMGRKTSTDQVQANFYPLLVDYGIRVREDHRGELFSTQALLSDGNLESALSDFHYDLCKALIGFYEQQCSEELSRLADIEAFEEHLLDKAMTDFAEVLGAPKTAPKEKDVSSDPLFDSLERVTRATGIQLNLEIRDKYLNETDPLDAICQAANIRTRQVLLSFQWWRQDNGPLLGRIKDSDLPVALIPHSAGSYVMVKPNGEKTSVTEAIANSLVEHAHMFYRPLPERSLKLMDLLNYVIRGTWKDGLMIMLMASAVTLMGLVIPIATGIVYDQIIPKASLFELRFIVLALFACALANGLFQATRALALVRFEGRIDAALQAAIWDRVLSLPVPFFKDFSSGDLNQRVMGVEQIRSMLSGQLILSLIASVFSIFYLALLFAYSVEMAMVALFLAALAVIPLGLSIFKVTLERKLYNMEGHLTGLLIQLLQGISKLRTAGAEEKALAYWAEPFARFKRVGYKAGLIEIVMQAWNEAFSIISLIAIFAAYLFFNADEVAMTPGLFIAFSTAFTLFLSGITTFSDVIVRILSLIPIYERSKPILKAQPEATETLAQPGQLTGSLEVAHLNFRYHEEQAMILRDISLKIQAGSFVAIVGPTGSGKSTLLRMLLGFEKPDSGAVYYDGMDLAGLDVRSVRRQIGVVLQNSQLVPGSIFSNIVGSLPLNIDQAWEAATMAGLADDIRAMPMGMHTIIGEGNVTFSGGQVQRLLIARALVNKPRLLFFDEATSALDNQTQAVVTDSLSKLSVTRLVIAHRLSTVIGADQIVVIDDGRIVERGTYDELMAMNGLFSRLANRQLV